MLSKLENLFRKNMALASEQSSTSHGVTVSHLSKDPDRLWEILRVKQVVNKVEPLTLNTPISKHSVRFVCISDTHSSTHRMAADMIPPGDVLIHAGDFTKHGQLAEISNFNDFLGLLPHRHKIVIAGNHDIPFDEQFLLGDRRRLKRFFRDPDKLQSEFQRYGVSCAREMLTNCTYLQDSEISVYGLRVYGSPWQPLFCDWAFNLVRGYPCLQKWDLIPQGIDVLVTHGPPLGHGDYTKSDRRAGCAELLSTVQQRVRPKYHVFGHIHEGYGVTSDGITTFINACTCNVFYRPVNPAVIFDIDLPDGISKDTVVPSS